MSDVPRFAGVEVQEGAVVDSSAKIGEGTFVRPLAVVRPNASVGINCNIHSHVFIDDGVVIGRGCKLEPGAKIFRGVTVEDLVFIGPGVSTTNDMYPRADVPNDSPISTLIGRGASIAANATIRCGITVGPRALIGAGAVVTRDVLPYALVEGVPARHTGWVNDSARIVSRDPKNIPEELVKTLTEHNLLEKVHAALNKSLDRLTK